MIASVSALTILSVGLFAQTAKVTVPVSDDVWVYPHAADPGKDLYMRVWGNGRSTPAEGDDEQNFSYGFASFSLEGVSGSPESLKSATLTLYQAPKGTYTPEMAKEFPIEIRKLTQPFTEKTWDYEKLSQIRPVGGKDGLLAFQTMPASGAELAVRVDIDLLKLPLGKEALQNAFKTKVFAVALTSGIDPSEGRASYKFHSKDSEAKYRPEMTLEFASKN